MAKPGARDRTAGRFGLRAYLADTITSLRAQRFRGVWEIVVVGNNCTDDTAEIARGLGARVVGERMRGVCNARQRGSRGEQGIDHLLGRRRYDLPDRWLATSTRRSGPTTGSSRWSGHAVTQTGPYGAASTDDWCSTSRI